MVIQSLPLNLDHFPHLRTVNLSPINRSFDRRYGSRLHWYVPLGVGAWLETNLAGPINVHELSWWDESTASEATTNASVVVGLVPANHWGRRTITDKNAALWGGFVVVGERHRFYFAGDTGYAKEAFEQVIKYLMNYTVGVDKPSSIPIPYCEVQNMSR